MVTLETLTPRLRELRLSGMRTGIAARAEEARTRSLDPVEFLLLLLDDELARREADGVSRTIARARFEEGCDLRDFDFTYNPQIPKAQLWELVSGRNFGEHAAVLLYGPTGVGKSFIAQALGVAACRPRRRTRGYPPKAGVQLASPAPSVPRAGVAHPRRLRYARVHDCPGRGPL